MDTTCLGLASWVWPGVLDMPTVVLRLRVGVGIGIKVMIELLLMHIRRRCSFIPVRAKLCGVYRAAAVLVTSYRLRF